MTMDRIKLSDRQRLVLELSSFKEKLPGQYGKTILSLAKRQLLTCYPCHPWFYVTITAAGKAWLHANGKLG